jgi:hypothetical protein
MRRESLINQPSRLRQLNLEGEHPATPQGVQNVAVLQGERDVLIWQTS